MSCLNEAYTPPLEDLHSKILKEVVGYGGTTESRRPWAMSGDWNETDSLLFSRKGTIQGFRADSRNSK